MAKNTPATTPSDSFTRSLPFDHGTESGLLGCFFHNPADLIPDAALTIPVETFYHPSNRLIYEEILGVHQENRPFEYLSFSRRLTDKKLIEKCGGPGRIAELLDFVPTPTHYGYFKDILLRLLKLRRLIGVCTDYTSRAYDLSATQEDPEILIQDAVREMEKINASSTARFETLKEFTDARMADYIDIMHGEIEPGIRTGFPTVDKLTGGYRPAHIWVIAGGTSDGKSAFALNLAVKAAEKEIPVGYWLYEMSVPEKMDRLFGMVGKIASDEFLTGFSELDSEQRLASAGAHLKKLPLYLRDKQGTKLKTLIADIRLGVRKHGLKLAFIDYLQLVDPDERGRTKENEVSDCSKALKNLAKDLSITIFLLSQVNAEGNLRDSRAIGHDADKVIILEVPKGREKGSRIEHKRDLYFPKNRGGQRFKRVHLKFEGKFYSFEECIDQSL